MCARAYVRVCVCVGTAKAEREGEDVPFWGLYGDIAGGQDTNIALNVESMLEEDEQAQSLKSQCLMAFLYIVVHILQPDFFFPQLVGGVSKGG